jgi:hypothetical protein
MIWAPHGEVTAELQERTMKGAASPLNAGELVDEYFIENRTRLLEIAAFLDRLDRADPSVSRRDFRIKAFNEALTALGRPGDRLDSIQLLLSDPRVGPIDALDRKSAIGAYDHWNGDARS